MGMFKKRISFNGLAGVLCVILLLGGCSEKNKEQDATFIDRQEKLIIQCSSECSAVVEKVLALNGTVTAAYQNVDALAVTVPVSNVSPLREFTGVSKLRKDIIIRRPINLIPNAHLLTNLTDAPQVPFDISTMLDPSMFTPDNYLLNNIANRVAGLHMQGITGKDVIVAIIDSGIANNADVVSALAGSVIGGENFVDLPGEPSATSTQNFYHGTMVGSVIAAHTAFVMPKNSPFVESLQLHSPQSVFPYDADNALIPLLGTAPDASLYALKVFHAGDEHNEEGSFITILLSAMDRALTLKKNYNAGIVSEPVSGDGSEENPFVYDSLNIQVLNMSLGSSTMFPGNEVVDLLVLEMLKNGITVVTSTGNSGFAAISSASPSSSAGTIAVGAASSPAHERLYIDMEIQPGLGATARVDSNMQVAMFSSRGPTTDGRTGVDLVANGVAVIAQRANGELSFGDGTSFSSPAVAGAAALLWSATKEREMSAAQIRHALIQSGNADIFVNPGDGAIYRGQGFLDAKASLSMLTNLESDELAEITIPSAPKIDDEPTRVVDNIEHLDLAIVDLSDDKVFTAELELSPAETINFFVPTDIEIEQLVVKFTNISAELSPTDQGFSGDHILLTVVDATTSESIHPLVMDQIFNSDSERVFPIPLPQSGLVRIAAMGTPFNAGKVRATMEVSASYRKLSKPVFKGSVRDDEEDTFRLEVDSSVTQLDFELSWRADWGSYPAHDIDLFLIDPDGNLIYDAATDHSPERLHIENPMPGSWDVVVIGYMLHGLKDRYALRITDQDGEPINDGDND